MAIKQKRGLIAIWNDAWLSDPVKAANALDYSMFLCAAILLFASVSVVTELLLLSELQCFFIAFGVVLVSAFVYINVSTPTAWLVRFPREFSHALSVDY